MTRRGLALTMALALAALPAAAQDGAATSDALGRVAVELGQFAIVVVVVESALSALFNWRVWRQVFNQRALKTPVMFAAGLLVVLGFGYDIFARILNDVGAGIEAQGNWGSVLISALIIAGGSSGINTLFRNLGLRQVLPDAPPKPALSQSEAWISVKVNGGVPGDAFHVAIAPSTLATGPELAGSVEVKSFGVRLREAFRSEPQRFPNYGGWSLDAGKPYRIEVIDTRAPAAKPKLVFEGSFAPRAIIDFQVKI